MLAAWREHGDVVRLKMGPKQFFLLVKPEHVRQVLQDHAAKYSKRTRSVEKNRLVLGNGLLTSEGEFWLKQRRIAQPAFHRARIAGFATDMAALTERMCERWSPRGEGRFDVSEEMTHLALEVVGKTLLSADFSASASDVGESVEVLLRQFFKRYTSIIDWPQWIPTAKNREFQAATAVLDRVVVGTISERRKNPGQHQDLLAMLMEATDPDSGDSMSDRQLRDEVMTLVLAGHETVANALAWAFYLLARNPEAQEKLAAELREVLGGRLPTFEDLPKLTYTAQVVSESLRLYPPGWVIAREVEEDDEVAGYRIPRGSAVFVSPFICHRNPAVFENPERFEPERFSPERAAALPRFAYFPFGGGPRQCIGNMYALMEAQLIIATVVRRFRIRMAEDREVEIEPTLTLRPRGGLWVTAAPR